MTPQRHKLGQNLTPVTPETFAKWKRTRMDKKQAEEDAVRKAKETTHAAGKNTGMSGRDLVRLVFYFSDLFTPVSVSTSIVNLISTWIFPTVYVQPRMVPGGRRGGRGLGFGQVSETEGRGGRGCRGGTNSAASDTGGWCRMNLGLFSFASSYVFQVLV